MAPCHCRTAARSSLAATRRLCGYYCGGGGGVGVPVRRRLSHQSSTKQRCGAPRRRLSAPICLHHGCTSGRMAVAHALGRSGDRRRNGSSHVTVVFGSGDGGGDGVQVQVHSSSSGTACSTSQPVGRQADEAAHSHSHTHTCATAAVSLHSDDRARPAPRHRRCVSQCSQWVRAHWAHTMGRGLRDATGAMEVRAGRDGGVWGVWALVGAENTTVTCECIRRGCLTVHGSTATAVALSE